MNFQPTIKHLETWEQYIHLLANQETHASVKFVDFKNGREINKLVVSFSGRKIWTMNSLQIVQWLSLTDVLRKMLRYLSRYCETKNMYISAKFEWNLNY